MISVLFISFSDSDITIKKACYRYPQFNCNFF